MEREGGSERANKRYKKERVEDIAINRGADRKT